MAENSDSLKAPKSSFKQVHEIAQKLHKEVKVDYEIHTEGFLATLHLGDDTFTGTGSNKTTAKDNASEEALEILSLKSTPTPEKKGTEKTAVTELNELCQRLKQPKLRVRYDEAVSVGDEFVCKLVIIHGKEEGGEGEEKHEGKGRSKKDAKHNAASVALQKSDILQSFKDDSCTPTTGRSYECRQTQTGYALIVYFTKDRAWADQDINNIIGFMENTLKFRCIVVKDPKEKELMQVLKETATHLNDNARDYYCFTFFIMGHGNQFGINTVDNGKKRTISVDDILENFKNNKIPAFTGKPKAFFIQSCRGEAYQDTMVQPDNDEEEEDAEKFRVPTDGDIFIAYSTTEGYRSYRHKAVGSIFIYSCVNIFEKNYPTTHLEEMMIDVKADIALGPRWRRTKDKKEIAQMPCSWSTLTKRFYFIVATL
ncbi:caspase-14-like [Crassostrea angulata]|uniref:caspase-14-like n=1 Tax=Magallana angulata TaxID=2784310 RepID=UPI0022B1BC06|nr:caspase-14-like [Crassostrea angulata]